MTSIVSSKIISWSTDDKICQNKIKAHSYFKLSDGEELICYMHYEGITYNSFRRELKTYCF